MGMGMVITFYHGDVRVPAQDLPLAIVRSLGGYPRSSTGVGTEWRTMAGGLLALQRWDTSFVILYCVLFPGRDNIKRQQPPIPRGALFRRVYYDSDSALSRLHEPKAKWRPRYTRR